MAGRNTAERGRRDELDSGLVVGIESRFLEWVDPKSNKEQPFKPKYFPPDKQLWQALSLVNCQSLAEDLQARRVAFRHLDGAQLLKHVLGMATSRGTRFELYYLYFDTAGPEAETHRAEITEFSERAGKETGFRWMTYRQLFSRLATNENGEHSGYLSYLGQRYFGAVV